ncbi:MAG: iron-sulfur cluster repair di-iron protein [Acidobacteriia bacterium]|nr:iron-sulfur cluster repair di-iron protein [Terriglobia bacterium]
MVISEAKTVGELAAEVPSAARVFEKYGIDYCCGGKHPVKTVCQERGIALETLEDELDQAAASKPEPADRDWNTASLQSLIGHILLRHHAYLRSELPRIAELFAKVVNVHGDRQPVLFQVREIFTAMHDELDTHMMKEELILFPAIGKLESGMHPPASSIDRPIHRLEHEHENADRALVEMRELTRDYTIPNDAGSAYRALFAALVTLESDLHRHIHLENNILFPRAAKLES